MFRYDADGTISHLTTRDGLPTDFVRCVTEDREGNIWTGTEGGGLCRLKPALFRQDLMALFELLRQKKIRPLVAQRSPLTEARRAYELLGEGGVTGKFVLVSGDAIA